MYSLIFFRVWRFFFLIGKNIIDLAMHCYSQLSSRVQFTASTFSGKHVFKYCCALKEESWKMEGRCPLWCIAGLVPKDAKCLVLRHCEHHRISPQADQSEKYITFIGRWNCFCWCGMECSSVMLYCILLCSTFKIQSVCMHHLDLCTWTCMQFKCTLYSIFQ